MRLIKAVFGGIDFDVKCLTNLSQDHLDYHESLEAYHQVKRSFLTTDYGHDSWDSSLPKKDTQFILPEAYHAQSQEILSQLKGDFNQRNLNAAKSILVALGVSNERALELLSQTPPPPGRFESIKEMQPFDVIVDFAHTPDGLENILIEAKSIAKEKKGRLLTLFGCGGDRDKGKRPKMGAVAEQYSDLVVVTSDNPRSESEQAIMDDILEGIQNRDHIGVQPNRHQAIRDILEKAAPNDVVVLAGKGHEDYQILKSGKIDFDDRQVAREILKEMHKKDRLSS